MARLTPPTRPDLRTDLELAGLSPDVPTIGASWTVPAAIAIHDDHLVWSGAHRRRHVDPRPDFLMRFAALARVPDDQLGVAVLAFARQWGVLRLCAHGLPSTHRPLRFAVGNDQPPAVCQPRIGVLRPSPQVSGPCALDHVDEHLGLQVANPVA